MATFTDKANGNWNAAGQTTWNEAGVPGTGDDVTISGFTVTMTQSETCGSIDIQSGGSLDLGSYTLTVDGGATDADVTIANVSGRLTKGTGTVDITGTGNLSNPHYDNGFYIVKVAAPSQTTTLTGDARTRFLEIGSGAFALGTNSLTYGDAASGGDKLITANASATITNGTIISNGPSTGTCTIDGFTMTSGGDLQTGSAGTIQLVTRGLTCVDLFLYEGNIDLNDQNLIVTGDVIVGATWTPIDASLLCGSGTVDIAGDFRLDNGGGAPTVVLNMESCTFQIAGNFEVEAGCTVTPGTSTITFDGSGAQSVTLNGESFATVVVNKSGGTLTIIDTFTCGGFTNTLGTFDLVAQDMTASSIAINGGVFDASDAAAPTITCAGSFTVANVSGLFVKGTSTIDLTGTGNLSNPNFGNSFYILKVAATSQTTTLTGGFRTRFIDIGAGTLGVNTQTCYIGTDSASSDKIIIAAATSTITATVGNGQFVMGSAGVTIDGFTANDLLITILTGTTTLVTRALSVWRINMTNGIFDANDFNITNIGQLNVGASTSTAQFICGSGIIDVASFYLESSGGTPNLDMESCTFNCAGDFDVEAGATVTAGTAVINLDGATACALTTAGQTLPATTVNKTGNGVTLVDALTCGNLTLTDGTWDSNGQTIACVDMAVNTADSKTFDGTITASGDVTFGVALTTARLLISSGKNLSQKESVAWTQTAYTNTDLDGVLWVSALPGTAANYVNQAGMVMLSVTATDINATNEINAIDASNIDGGGNTNWDFIGPFTISPSSGFESGGTSVIITGTNFGAAQGTGSVTFGGVAATAYAAWSDTEITCTTPAGTIGAQDVIITGDTGESETKSGGYTYVIDPTNKKKKKGVLFMAGSEGAIKKVKVFDGETVNNSTGTSIVIDLSQYMRLGYFSLQVKFDSTPAGAPSIDFNYEISNNGEDFMTPSSASAIKTAHIKTSGPGSDGQDIYGFELDEFIGGFLRITATETATAAGTISAWLAIQ